MILRWTRAAFLDLDEDNPNSCDVFPASNGVSSCHKYLDLSTFLDRSRESHTLSFEEASDDRNRGRIALAMEVREGFCDFAIDPLTEDTSRRHR